MRNFREFEIWKDSRIMVNKVYDKTDDFPSNEKFGMTSQLNRDVVSIMLNIAEGASRKSEKDFARFLEISIGSAFEVESLLLIASDRKFITEKEADDLLLELNSIQKRINSFIGKLR